MAPAWEGWLTGLVNATISGAASGAAAGMVGTTWKQALAVAGTSAIVSLAKWILQHPLPGSPE